jgi:uracil-DNA glycosylase family protein
MPKVQASSAAPFIPNTRSLRVLAAASQSCEGCDLFRHATQAVFGEGPAHAEVMLIGEQPGDQEDLQGHPFVGPAGQILSRALTEAEIDRDDVYITNAVKHFKFEERGKRRIHKKPNGFEISACNPWLEAEIGLVKPRILVAMGATATLALAGKLAKLTRDRSKLLPHPAAEALLLTVHPSLLLRMPEREKREEEYARFVGDLRLVKKRLSA